MSNIKVGSRVRFFTCKSSIKNIEFIGEVVNISDYREPSMKYAVSVPEFNDLVFISDNHIVEVCDDSEDKR